MFLEINTPEGMIFEGKTEKVIIPTKIGEICLLPHHQPLISIMEPGIVKIKLPHHQQQEFIKGTKFLFEDERMCVSVGSGVIYGNGSEIALLTSTATSELETDEEVLKTMKAEMEKQIEEIKLKGSLDEIEKAFLHLQKITADLKLHKLKKRM